MIVYIITSIKYRQILLCPLADTPREMSRLLVCGVSEDYWLFLYFIQILKDGEKQNSPYIKRVHFMIYLISRNKNEGTSCFNYIQMPVMENTYLWPFSVCFLKAALHWNSSF